MGLTEEQILNGYPEQGRFLDERANPQNIADLIRRFSTFFSPLGGMQVSEYTPVFDIAPVAVSIFTDRAFTSGSATIEVVDGEYKLSNPGGETCRLETAQRGPYQPGLVGLPGIAGRRTTAPTGTTVYRLGFFDVDDGFGFGEDSGGLFTFVRKNGVTSIVNRREDWLDPLDGTGPSGFDLDLLNGRIHRIPYSYYGYGSIEFGIVAAAGGGKPDEFTVVDRYTPSHGLSVTNPNLPVTAEIEGDSAGELYIGGRQYGVIGRLNLARKIVGEYRTNQPLDAANGFVPAISARLRNTKPFIKLLAQASGVSLLPNSNLEWYLGLGGEINSSNFNIAQFSSANESAMEFCVDATAFVTEPEIMAGPDFVIGGTGSKINSESFDIPDQDVPVGEPVTIAVKPKTGTASLDSSLRIAERR